MFSITSDPRYQQGLWDARTGNIEPDATDQPYLKGIYAHLKAQGLEDPIKPLPRHEISLEALDSLDHFPSLGRRHADLDRIDPVVVPDVGQLIHAQIRARYQ